MQIAYAIGKPKPVSVTVDTFGTSAIPDDVLAEAIQCVFDFRPAALIRDLSLRQPIYQPLAAYGQVGREGLGLPWERTGKVSELLDTVSYLMKEKK